MSLCGDSEKNKKVTIMGPYHKKFPQWIAFSPSMWWTRHIFLHILKEHDWLYKCAKIRSYSCWFDAFFLHWKKKCIISSVMQLQGYCLSTLVISSARCSIPHFNPPSVSAFISSTKAPLPVRSTKLSSCELGQYPGRRLRRKPRWCGYLFFIDGSSDGILMFFWYWYWFLHGFMIEDELVMQVMFVFVDYCVTLQCFWWDQDAPSKQ